MPIAENDATEWNDAQEASLREQAEGWFDQLRLLKEEQTMGSQVQKVAVSLLTGVLLTATVPEVEAAAKYSVGRCQVASKDLQVDLYPAGTAKDYIYEYQRENPKFKSIDPSDFRRGAKVTLLSQPKFGEIEQTDNNWFYQPTTFNEDRTYVGRDSFVMKVENKGIAIFVHYYIEVIGNDPTTYIGDDGERYAHDYCKRESWKISLPSTGDNPALTFTDLTGSAVGETLGTGKTAQITLDTNAAGHNWYIDYTPYLNDEYLPTSNPLEWIAKPGRALKGSASHSFWNHHATSPPH